jgi:hypothetical protein
VRVGDVALHVTRLRPDHVEVLEADGRHHTVRVPDLTFAARLAISAASVVAVALARRHTRGRSTP